MIRDSKLFRRDVGKEQNSDEIENLPTNPNFLVPSQPSTGSTRDPLHSIPDPTQISKHGIDKELGFKGRIETTPTKPKVRNSDTSSFLRTPDRQGNGTVGKNRFGWSSTSEARNDMANYLGQSSRNGGSLNMTPRVSRATTVGRTNSTHSESNSFQTTPTKSVSKPPYPGTGSYSRTGTYAALTRGFPTCNGQPTAVNTVQVPHFDLKEDPSFWMDHNVQVIIRVRPLNNSERNTQGYNRCVRQETPQNITWIGQPETRFTFDHVACETVDQEMLFRMAGLPMVENCLSGYNSCMFAYGQTGSGKTYTMLGDIDDLEFKPSPHRGMTPRIFEFLFARIRAEEESRRDEKLKYSCKCSFLEIYNEQITDLLNPSSANLLLREDVRTGVYVENLSEFEVCSVGDILGLLAQGSSNRKVAATNMNKESSRSHCVFTCVIESKWERDSTTNLRFARLNLVDLAGSERQKTSGAEGERLKEAANINKSLSTLGHVIMVLVDVANGRIKHVPYRDSRLTFLLQDSLGGNSKTIIIANISPSVSCAAETLNTLKFAQRAKLIQNNAIVNEDSSGDVSALQHQIRLLKEELSALKRQNVSRSLSFGPLAIQYKEEQEDVEMEIDEATSDDSVQLEAEGIKMSSEQLISLEKMVAGALRREQMTETSIKKLEAEIEQLNHLVHLREEDARCSKMQLKFREDKVRRMDSFLKGAQPLDSYLLEENAALSEEIKILQAKVAKNPEVTRFAVENIRLSEQLRRFQDFYEEGEREILLSEVSELRDKLIQILDEKNNGQEHPKAHMTPAELTESIKEKDSLHAELNKTRNELDECQSKLRSCLENNIFLERKIDELHHLLHDVKPAVHNHNNGILEIKDPEIPGQKTNHAGDCENDLKTAEELLNLELELDILKIILKEEKLSRAKADELACCLSQELKLAEEGILSTRKQYEDAKEELREAKSVIEALESQQLLSINEIEDLKNQNRRPMEHLQPQQLELAGFNRHNCHPVSSNRSMSKEGECSETMFQVKLTKMQASLEKTKKLNLSYQRDHALQKSDEEERDETRRQVEAETAQVILCLQEELSTLLQQEQESAWREKEVQSRLNLLETTLREQQEAFNALAEENGALQESAWREKEVQSRLNLLETTLREQQEAFNALAEENGALQDKLRVKEKDIEQITAEWKLLSGEIEGALADGHEALIDASDQIGTICSYIPGKGRWISEQVHRFIKQASEKDLVIEELNMCLESSNARLNDMENMLRSLKGATLVITESHQKECSEKEKELLSLRSELSAKVSAEMVMEGKMHSACDEMSKSSKCATAAFVIINRLMEINSSHLDTLRLTESQLKESLEASQMKDDLLCKYAAASEEAERQIQVLKKEIELSEGNCSLLGAQLAKQQTYISQMEKRLGEYDDLDILKTQEKLSELKAGVFEAKSHMDSYARQTAHWSMKDGSTDAWLDAAKNQEKHQDYYEYPRDGEFGAISEVCSNPSIHRGGEEDEMSIKICKDAKKKDATIILLRKEIESAMESLREVQEEMVRLHAENQEISINEKQCREGMGIVQAQVCHLQAAFDGFEGVCLQKMQALIQKLLKAERFVEEASESWDQANKFFDEELSTATLDIAQRTAEASCLLSKYEEAQAMMKEADVMIKGLMIANETMKLEMKDLKSKNGNLSFERDRLVQDIESLHSYLANDQQCHQLIQELETLISEVRLASEEAVLSVAHDVCSIKSQVHDSTSLIQSWLEDFCSDIIVKDSAVSVLHLCHTGTLLETVMRLNTKNCLLNNGLGESQAIISLLKKQSLKAVQELETCNMLKGNLLADVKRSFDCITRKEWETDELSAKLIAFETKITDLQLQEELMLESSNHLGFELANLVKDLNESNSNAMTSLLEQEKILNNTKEAAATEAENLIVEVSAKDLELLIMTSVLKQLFHETSNMISKEIGHSTMLESLKQEFVALSISTNTTEHLLLERNAVVNYLQKELEAANVHMIQSCDDVTYLDVYNTALKEELLLQREIAFLNDKLERELHEASVDKEKMSTQLQRLEIEYSNLEEKVIKLEGELGLSSSHASLLDQQNQDLQNKVKIKDEQICRMKSIEEANVTLKEELIELNRQNTKLTEVFHETESQLKSCESHIEIIKMENTKLQESVHDLGLKVSLLQEDLDLRRARLEELQCSSSSINEELHRDQQKLQENDMKISALEEENRFLKEEMRCLEHSTLESLTMSSCHTAKCLDLMEAAEIHSDEMHAALHERTESISRRLSQDTYDNLEMVVKINNALESLDTIVNDLKSENVSLQAELLRKDDVLKGLLFDISLLQESTSNSKDLKDEIEELTASLNLTEDELMTRTCELDIAEAQVQEKINRISLLERDLSTATHAIEMSLKEKVDLTSRFEEISVSKSSLEREVTEKVELIDSLETRILGLENSIAHMSGSINSLKSELDEANGENDRIHKELLLVEEKLDTAQELAQEYEAIAVEAKQIAESRREYGEEKEEEARLLEKSVEELDRTVNILENKVDMLKEEAERQRLQREELELELQSLKTQMDNLRSADSDTKRELEEKEKYLLKASQHVQSLEKDLSDKDAEIAQCKAHIAELNLHAEVQASEYKKKFKALEAMAEQVKPDGPSSQGKSASSYKLEKNAPKTRGSGSPFKCMGLGLAHQLKLEKGEDTTAERLRIQELEALAASRQKEIFVLNNRLAAAESMTHDVIRDLLGVKLDMTNYMSLLDKQQVQKIAEDAQPCNADSDVKVEETSKLKKLLVDFVNERKGWLEEIDRKQSEFHAAQLALEGLSAENQFLKVEVGGYKKKTAELEGEVNKLSGQQNLHQRIHHHAKIKEENSLLKCQNEELSARLEKAEAFLMRVKEQLARSRACSGKIPFIDFDEEKRLENKLKETEGQRIQLAKDLLSLCTNIFKAAGIKKQTSDISLSSAEDALEGLTKRIASLERDIDNLKLKSRIADERTRISEFMLQSPLSKPRHEDSCMTPRRASPSPFFSSLDR